MNVYRYTTAGGKDVIVTYIQGLPKKAQYEYYSIIELLEAEGTDAFHVLDTKTFQGQIREIRFDQQRLFYVLQDGDNLYILHARRKRTKPKRQTKTLS